MVLTITAPLWADISDRASRILGGASLLNSGLTPLAQRPWQQRIQTGRLVFYDDFEGTLRWTQNNATMTQASDATFVVDGIKALKLVTGAVAAASASGQVVIVPFTETDGYAVAGIWLCLSAAAASTPRYVNFSVQVQDRALNSYYLFALQFANYVSGASQHKLQYMNSASAWVDLTGGGASMTVTGPVFVYFAICMKRVTGTGWLYQWVQFNDRKFDLTGVAAHTYAFTDEGVNIDVGVVTDVAAASTCYADCLTVVDSLQTIP